uniref:Putative secreted protein n=1 Tax=Ixodes ricinus TaxID=34613 RepID=A0A6B0TXW6_IXORI
MAYQWNRVSFYLACIVCVQLLDWNRATNLMRSSFILLCLLPSCLHIHPEYKLSFCPLSKVYHPLHRASTRYVSRHIVPCSLEHP